MWFFAAKRNVSVALSPSVVKWFCAAADMNTADPARHERCLNYSAFRTPSAFDIQQQFILDNDQDDAHLERSRSPMMSSGPTLVIM